MKIKEGGVISIKQTTRTIMRLLWKEGGVRRLYAGLTASYLKVVPSVTISLLVRDALLGHFDNS